MYSDCTCTVSEPYLLRTNSVVSPYRGTSDRRRYGASTVRIRCRVWRILKMEDLVFRV
ncbi:hypothetical protein BACCELL_01480 [Bacteroides cellulosilyticus DSM 14838]|uniref:Uncharacterized protein n=1 Tax=Bacteroides cellulosilyticus DSM 14838 TaxID=537012 RepID=E2NB24_9BACE|nr:hypothetical protein BACCELL_01480 [Bacteroides cellulosilyticus DSM 14838]